MAYQAYDEPTERFLVQIDTLVMLRWLAVFGQSAAVLTGYFILGLELEIDLVALVISVLAVANIAFRLIFPRNSVANNNLVTMFFVLDLLQLGTLLALTGGLNNPFALLILAPSSVGTSLLPLRMAGFIGVIAVLVVIGLECVSFPINMNGESLTLPAMLRAGFAVSLVFGIIFIGYYARRLWNEVQMMNDALYATREALAREQKLSDLGGVVAAAAHELGTPLATIKLVSRELRDSVADDAELCEDVDIIHSQADRCRDILRDMGRQGQEDHLQIPVPLQALIEEAAGPHMDRAHVVVEIDPQSVPSSESEQPMVERRPEVLHGLRNLIQNAVDFSAEQVTITLLWSETLIQVCVKDDGPGFPQYMIGRLGNPIWRKKPALERPNYEGMGLGLFIAKTLLGRSGAKLRFTNDNGAVATVRWDRAAIEVI